MVKFLDIHQNINILNCALSVADPQKANCQLVVSPNPAKDFIDVAFQGMENGFEVELVNALGQRVFNANNLSRLNTAAFERGVYFLKIVSSKQERYYGRVVLQ
jgi:hypothetical protein